MLGNNSQEPRGKFAMTFSDTFARWLYRGQRPNSLAKAMNSVSEFIGRIGLAGNYMVALQVKGRNSGRTISFPVVVALVAGERYLVAMLGENVAWVRNVRAAGGRAVLRHGRCEAIILDELPPAQRAPILRAFLRRAPGGRPHIPVDKNAQLSEFEKVAAAFPVFRVRIDPDEDDATHPRDYERNSDHSSGATPETPVPPRILSAAARA